MANEIPKKKCHSFGPQANKVSVNKVLKVKSLKWDNTVSTHKFSIVWLQHFAIMQ